MSNILSRIQEISAKEGLTITAFERSIGASKGVLSRAINNGTDIQSKWIQTIVENYPLYSSRWLLTGKGEMLLQPTKENDEKNSDSPSYLIEKIADQAEEIGRLKARIEELERNKGDNAGDAPGSSIANVG